MALCIIANQIKNMYFALSKLLECEFCFSIFDEFFEIVVPILLLQEGKTNSSLQSLKFQTYYAIFKQF